jgi:glycosyltransferase involved in cell wall biosynthesis
VRASRPPLRVALLAEVLATGGGMGRYVREVLRELGRRSDVRLTVMVPPEARDELRSLVPANLDATVELEGRGQIGRALWERYRSGNVLARHGVEVVHGAKQLLPKRMAAASVLTVHDVMPITWPSQFTLAKRILLPRQFRASMGEATVLVAVSHVTARRISTLDPGLAQKTVVIPNGVTTALLDVASEPIRQLDGRDFALVVSDLSPRKNVAMLGDIWDDVWSATGMTLVSVGPQGSRSGKTRQRLDALTRNGRAVRLEHISDAELRWCYEHARVVLLPTIEEGFGLPAIEALALGAPVITSDDDALVEACEGRATHVNPRDPVVWTRAVVEVVQHGVSAASTPPTLSTWEDHVAQLVAVYRTAIDRRGGPPDNAAGAVTDSRDLRT